MATKTEKKVMLYSHGELLGDALLKLPIGHSNVEKFVHYGKRRRVLEAKQFGGVEMHRIPLKAGVEEIDDILS